MSAQLYARDAVTRKVAEQQMLQKATIASVLRL